MQLQNELKCRVYAENCHFIQGAETKTLPLTLIGHKIFVSYLMWLPRKYSCVTFTYHQKPNIYQLINCTYSYYSKYLTISLTKVVPVLLHILDLQLVAALSKDGFGVLLKAP